MRSQPGHGSSGQGRGSSDGVRLGLVSDSSAAPMFDDFFRNNYVRLLNVLLLAGHPRDAAEDIAQEAMARAFEKWSRLATMEYPLAYVCRVAINIARRRRNGPSVAPVDDVVDVAERATDNVAVRTALESLDSKDRYALVLTGYLGMTSQDAAKLLGIAPSTLRTRLHRARNRLRSRLEIRDAH